MGLSRKLLPFLVLAAWIVITIFTIPLSGRLSEVAGNPDSVELPRGSEATRTAALTDRFPDSGAATAVLIYLRAGGLTDADRAKVTADRTALAGFADGPIAPARASADGAALALNFRLPSDADEGARAVRTLARADAPPGLRVVFSGTAGAALAAGDASDRLARLAMIVTAIVVTVLLLLTYRSPVLWLLPLINVGVAYLAGDAVLYALGRYLGVTVSTGNAAVVTVLLFGVGTDYALLLLARYRDELRRESDRRVAMAAALRGAVPAIAASAATVSLGLLCLLAADMGFNFTFGPAGAVAVLCAFVVMVTLLPALLVILGRWVFWPVIPRPGTAGKSGLGWARIGTMISGRPRLVWVASAVVLGVFACGAIGMRTGLDDADRFAGTPEAVVGQQILHDHFGVRSDRPVQVVADSAAAAPVAAALRGVSGVVTVAPAVTSADGTLARLDVTTADPVDRAIVDRIRTAVHRVPGAHALVGGATAIDQAVDAAQAHDRRVVIPLVLVVVFLILVLLLRALVGSALLMATVVASYFAALGVAWFAFRYLFGFAAMDVQVMLIGFLFLVALGVDYNIFLLSRIRQEAARHGHAEGVRRGLRVTGGVITSAGVVLAATFSVLLLAPLVAFIEIGFVVAVGVLIDTLLVRSVLVPALALDVGSRFWWPSRPTPPTPVSSSPSSPAPVAVASGGRTG